MYAVTVTRTFVAQHFLTVPDPGPEGDVHSHRYEVEVRLEGDELGEYDYLVDIDDVSAALESVEDRYRDATLNALPEFDGHNPSVEYFATCIADRVVGGLEPANVDRIEVTVWEDETAAATYASPV